jgi:subtilase family serine protease
MTIVTNRRRRRGLGILTGLLAWLVVSATAQAAPGNVNHHGTGPNGSTRAGLASATPSAQGNAESLLQTTHLRASQVTAVAVCPAAAPGHVRCAAQALVIRSNHHPVRPLVSRRASLAQVLPRLAGGIAPAAGSVAQTPPGASTPAYLQQAYDLAYLSQTAGSSDTVAVVDAYDDPNAESDLATYRSTFGLPPCTTANGCFHKLNQSGTAAPLPAGNTGWEMEESLDLDAVSALCPNCHLVLVEATTSGLTDMGHAEVTAAAHGAKQISNSWTAGLSSVLAGTYTFPGVSVIAASGDTGYNGPGWDVYPAALPGVTAAGGTTLATSTTGAPSARGFSESAWSLSGGWGGGSGCDVHVHKPSYQTDTGCTGRSYSDVSADANPATGLIVLDSGNGGWLLLGGTSLSTPLLAGYEAVTGVSATPQWAYSDSALLNDPTTGSTGSCAANISYICNARVGYDGPTGAGSISGDVVPGGPGIGGPGVGGGAGNTYTQSVTAAGATLTGGVYPNGLATSYWWEYGTTTAYGNQTTATNIGAGHSPVSTTRSLTSLTSSTTYHYRLVAQNSAGATYGYDFTLTTGSLAPVATAAPAITGTPRVGQTLTASTGSWSPSGTYTYQWQHSTSATSGWSNVVSATGSTYTPVAGDTGASLRVGVTATNSRGHTIAYSGVAGPVATSATGVSGAAIFALAGLDRSLRG